MCRSGSPAFWSTDLRSRRIPRRYRTFRGDSSGANIRGPMQTVLEVQGLTRRFGDRFAVHDLAFSMASAEAVGLLGVNGAGKSTTLRLLAGYLVPHAGTARLCGYDVITHPREVRRRLGY